ncbi:MAG: replicative DNA helicase [Clostridia bacterium]|nr:replicative DNA helicase [Clostridia bacterium]
MAADPGRIQPFPGVPAGQALGKVPPNSRQAEQSVLGCVMSGEIPLAVATATLKPEDFYSPDHRLVYDAVCALAMTQKPVDIITVSDYLESKGQLAKCGGLSYISSLPDMAPVIAHIESYVDIVRQKAILRRLLQTLDEVRGWCYDDSNDADRLLDLSAKRIFDIRENRDQSGFSSMREIIAQTINEIHKMRTGEMQDRSVKTGYSTLDRVLGGLTNGSLVIVAARPSMGKTALALNIVQKTALIHGIPCAVFSLEMSKEEVASRMLSVQARMDSKHIRTGQLTQNDWERLADVVKVLSGAPIYVDDRSGTTVLEIQSRCRQLKLEGKLGLVVIDYMQLMSGGTRRNENRQQEISDISRSLKIMAKDLDVPVIAISQLSRANVHRENKRPMLSDLRDSGSIEQDADVVMFLHRPSYYENVQEVLETEVAEVIIAKNRQGETRTVNIGWQGQYTLFFDLPEHEAMPTEYDGF